MDSGGSIERSLTDLKYIQLNAPTYYRAGKDFEDWPTMVGGLDASASDEAHWGHGE